MKLNKKIKIILYTMGALLIGCLIILIIINSKKTKQEIFNEYYKSDKIYINHRSIRHESDTIKLEDCLILFENDKLVESLKCLSMINNQSITKIYYEGVINMELKNYDIAIYKFDEVIKDNLNIFYNQSLWYKGLCLLELEHYDESERIFKKLIRVDNYYKLKSEKILKDINELKDN